MRAVLAVLTCAALAGAALLWPGAPVLVLDRTVLPADGRATARAHLERPSLAGLRWPLREAAIAVEGAASLRAADGTQVIRAGTRPGVVVVSADPGLRAELTLRADPRDTDQDGLPDAAELLSAEDRAAFSAWFTTLAEGQATRIDDAWAPIHQDCAGLVRFAFREALKTHDHAWLERRRYLATLSAPDVAAFRYPDLPFIGDRPFRDSGGAFRDPDSGTGFDPRAPLDGTFTAAATARTLWQRNSTLISRDVADARPGDLLFFAVPHAPGSGLHTMIALGARPGAGPDDRVTRVVYHTGGDGEHGRGEVRVVSLADLARHPDAGWHPVAHNARFLGVHRLNHLHHEARALADLGPLGAP